VAPARDGGDGPVSRLDRLMHLAEGAVYGAVGLLLVASAILAVAMIGYRLATDLDEGTTDAVTAALDSLLLVFILVELLGAVRATVTERKLVAEPFLVVGIIASIKEIVVASLKAGDLDDSQFDEVIAEIAVLGVVVILLATSSFLVRRKEREPAEQ
jgi:uncharacterized membrane protein (DUF373 family)